MQTGSEISRKMWLELSRKSKLGECSRTFDDNSIKTNFFSLTTLPLQDADISVSVLPVLKDFFRNSRERYFVRQSRRWSDRVNSIRGWQNV